MGGITTLASMVRLLILNSGWRITVANLLNVYFATKQVRPSPKIFREHPRSVGITQTKNLLLAFDDDPPIFVLTDHAFWLRRSSCILAQKVCLRWRASSHLPLIHHWKWKMVHCKSPRWGKEWTVLTLIWEFLGDKFEVMDEGYGIVEWAARFRISEYPWMLGTSQHIWY